MVSNLEQGGWAGIYQEEQAFDHLFNYDDCFVEYDEYAKRQSTPEQRVIDSALREMPFDKGWCFWLGVDKVLGAQVPPGPQDCGCCVAYSSVLSVIDLNCHEIFVCGEQEDALVYFVPASYGFGRVYIGNNRLGRGDGSLGSWQIAADKKFGVLPTDLQGLPIKQSEPAEPRADITRLWGRSKTVLDEWKDKAAPHKIEVGTRITSGDQAWEAITQLFRPLTIASNWGFRKRGHDARYGITTWKRSGSWAHQMSVRAAFELKGQRFAYIGNQWGKNYHGTVGDGFPRGGFVVFWEEFERWIRDASVYARGKFQGRQTDYGGVI